MFPVSVSPSPVSPSPRNLGRDRTASGARVCYGGHGSCAPSPTPSDPPPLPRSPPPLNTHRLRHRLRLLEQPALGAVPRRRACRGAGHFGPKHSSTGASASASASDSPHGRHGVGGHSHGVQVLAAGVWDGGAGFGHCVVGSGAHRLRACVCGQSKVGRTEEKRGEKSRIQTQPAVMEHGRDHITNRRARGAWRRAAAPH